MRTDWCLQGSLRMSLVKQEYQKMLCHLLSFNRMFSLALTTAYFWEMRRKLATSAVCCPVRILFGRKVVTWFHCSTFPPLSLFSRLYFIGNSFHIYCCCYFCFSIFSICFVYREEREKKKRCAPPTTTAHTPPLPGSRITALNNTTTTTECVRCVYM